MEKKKLVFQLDTPFSSIAWPQITQENQDTILELLLTLISPVGHYRLRYITPSKGKKEKKRKRQQAGEKPAVAVPAVPPAPEIGSFIDVGLAIVTRSLQSTDPGATAMGGQAQDVNMEDTTIEPPSGSPPYSAIFVARSGQPSILNSHLPQMVAVASRTKPSEEPIRLVGLSKACQDRLSEALGIPRVSVIGLCRGAPNSKALIDFTQQHVPVVEAAWLKDSQTLDFKETKIKVVETTIGKRSKGKRGPASLEKS